MKLHHPDPSEVSIITENGTELSYVAFTGSGLSGGDELMRITENKWLSRLLQAAWNNKISLCVCYPLFCVLAVVIEIAIFTFMLSMAKVIAWLLVMSLIPCFYLMFQKHLSVKTAQKLCGTVVGYKEETDSNGGRMYNLIVEYSDHVWMKPKIISKISSSACMRKIGDQVIVLSYPDSTEKELFEERYIGYYVWICIGIAAIYFLFFTME